MTAKKKLSEIEIASKLKAGKDFFVETITERNKVYMLRKVFDKNVTARPDPSGGFNITFLSGEL